MKVSISYSLIEKNSGEAQQLVLARFVCNHVVMIVSHSLCSFLNP